MNEGAVIDELCPMGETISEQELRTKGKILYKLLKKLNNERKYKKDAIFESVRLRDMFNPLFHLRVFCDNQWLDEIKKGITKDKYQSTNLRWPIGVGTQKIGAEENKNIAATTYSSNIMRLKVGTAFGCNLSLWSSPSSFSFCFRTSKARVPRITNTKPTSKA
jgi:hypothetical protein